MDNLNEFQADLQQDLDAEELAIPNDSLLKDYEEDIKDSLKAVRQAEADIKEAVDWHYKMLVDYAKNITRLDNYKKGL